ncbi:MAG: N-6 DNA methylase [Elusimicrobia bacterium]|nr:N-6 DNA methylase [Elusimicrobiota bacterium]
MLDTDTKRRIDTARDILVGKVPDPKSQVEQITIALIYKFMDDLDAVSVEFGGKRKYFTKEFARYAWSKLMSPGLGGHDMLALYAEGIARIPENPGITPFFRDIFKNAYLPYRDPETLKSFLKIIDEFVYDHSERLGDAFEYLLSVLGSQGDAGQFRTPRHIIDFIVEVVAPRKGETILDPACGTAGFLISAYKHILKTNTDAKGHGKLTPDEKGRLAQNFKGYDISPDMVRLSRVNLYLHDFTDPHIYEYDTLTSEERWNEFADVILANPPFMSPKGGIKPHKRFSIQAKRSEVLFVDYIAEHLTPNGRAGIIVPEGIIFQSQTSYKDLRKSLVENSLVAVISLPAGCFNPYSGVKTSILLLDKSLAKQSDSIAFFKAENDGFGLGAQRRKIDKNDLPMVQAELASYLQALRNRQPTSNLNPTLGLIVPKSKLSANGDYNLSGERYREGVVKAHTFPLIRIAEVCAVNPRKSQLANISPDTRVSFVPMSDLKEHQISFQPKEEKKISEVSAGYTCFEDNDVLLAKVTPCFENGKAGIARGLTNGIGFGSSEFYVLRSGGRVLPEWIYFCVSHPLFRTAAVAQMTGTGGLQRVPRDYVENFRIPLPPLAVQKEIVAEIEGYQKVINGARAVIDNYRPHIPIRPDWPVVEIGAICDIVRGSSPRPQGDSHFFGGPVPRLMIADITRDGMHTTPRIDSLTPEGAAKSRSMKKGELVITVSGNPGLPTILAVDACIHDGFVGLRNLREGILPQFLYFTLKALHASHGSQSVGAVFKNLTTHQIREFKVALPPLATQKSIISEIENVQSLVAANHDLIAHFEKKIETTLAHLWGIEEIDTQNYSNHLALRDKIQH